MIAKLSQAATRRPKTVIAIWLVATIGLSVLAGLKGYSVTTDDTARFLPETSESARALALARERFGLQPGTATVTVLLRRADGAVLDEADRAAAGRLTRDLPRWRPDVTALATSTEALDVESRAGRVLDATPGPVSGDGRFVLAALLWRANTTDPVAQDAFRQFRDELDRRADALGLVAGSTGGVATAADRADADSGRIVAQQAALVGAIVLLALLFFRGPLAAIVPLLTVYLVAGGANGLVVAAALLLGFDLDVSTTQLITVVLVGVGVDYFLFLLFRVREQLRAGADRRAAASAAASRVGPVIASAALVVVAAFATLALAEFGQFRILGPAIAISVLVMLLAGVTLMPAVAAVTGPRLFWPSRSWRQPRETGPSTRLGTLVARRPRAVALSTGALLLALAVVALGARLDYGLDSGGPATPATRTADAISATLPAGAADVQPVYVDASRPLAAGDLEGLRQRLEAVPGVGSASEPAFSADRTAARIDVALDHESTSQAAIDLAGGPMRQAAHEAAPAGTTVLVAGTAAVFADVGASVDRDLRIVFPVAAALILLILIVALRSAVAPLYLLAAVVLEFAATLGAAVLAIQHLGGQAGIAFTLPLIVFLFVVALGTDYNLLMTARIREELLAGATVREAVAHAVGRVAPAIAAAGLVLASSFGTLMIASDGGSREIGFAMAAGILLAALVVATLMLPALLTLGGPRAWWPATVARTDTTSAEREPASADRQSTGAPRSAARSSSRARS